MVQRRNEKRNVDQWSRISYPEINPQMYGQLIFDKGIKNIQCKTHLFNNGTSKNGFHLKKNKLEEQKTTYFP